MSILIAYCVEHWFASIDKLLLELTYLSLTAIYNLIKLEDCSF